MCDAVFVSGYSAVQWLLWFAGDVYNMSGESRTKHPHSPPRLLHLQNTGGVGRNRREDVRSDGR